MLSASLPVINVTEGLIESLVLSKVTGKCVMAPGGIGNAKRFSQVLYHTPAELRLRKAAVSSTEARSSERAPRFR